MLLTFVHMHRVGEKQRYDVVRRVVVGTRLEGMTEGELGELLGREG